MQGTSHTRVAVSTWVIAIGFFFIFFGFGATQQFLAAIFDAAGKARLALVSLLILYGAFAVGGLVVPYVLTRLPLKKALVGAGATYVVFVVAAALGSPILLFAASVAIGVGAAFLWAASAEYITETVREDARGRNLGIVSAGQVIGAFSGISFVTSLLPYVSAPSILAILGATAFIGVLAFLLVSERHPASHHRATQYFASFREPLILVVVPLIVIGFFFLGVLLSGLPIFVGRRFTLASVGVVGAVVQGAFAVGTFASGAFSDRIGRYRTMVVAAFLFLVGALLLLNAPDIVVFTAGAAMAMVYSSMVYPVMSAVIGEWLPEEKRLHGFGMIQTAGAIGVIAAIVTSLFFSAEVLFRVLVGTALFAVCWTLWLGRFVAKPRGAIEG